MTSIPQSALISHLRDLIRIDSRSNAAGGCEGPLQRQLAGYFERAGAQVRLLTIDDLPNLRKDPLFHGPTRDYSDRPTLIAEIGPADAPALLLLAHSDTVPLFAPQEWTVDPFDAEMRDGRIYGLGSSDDKWGLACMMVLAEEFRAAHLKKRIILASTIDEESGVGNGALILARSGVRAEAALYLDGMEMCVSRGNTGGSTLSLAPDASISVSQRQQDLLALQRECTILSTERSHLFVQAGFADNWARDRSFITRGREDGTLPIAFYSLPGETRSQMLKLLDGLLHNALGRRTDDYRQSMREPWFEAAITSPDLPLLSCISEASTAVLRRDPIIGTTPKIDAFVLTNHAKIPTLSFGCTARTSGRGAFHEPDEYLTVEELTQAYAITHRTVENWLRL